VTDRFRVLFISHGGGPMPLLGDPGHSEMVACLKSIASRIPRPEAVIVVSAHWEAHTPTITARKNPPLIYDYYGFPEESYRIQYPCLGEPVLATEIQQLLSRAGIDANLDEQRGFDHGLFIPLKIMYPAAEIPCVQLSLVHTLDPLTHIAIGRALEPLRNRNLLVIGSGFSFHNMRAFFAPETEDSRRLNNAFEDWLKDTCTNETYSEAKRTDLLVHWSDAEGARYCHPREEHLLPLHVCYGVTHTPASEHFTLRILNKNSSMFLW